MAQLPPRAPSAAGQQDWSAAGEFLGFAASRRGAHRRSASDSAAFLEAVPMDDDVIGGGEFDRLDDEQLMSMFSDVDAPAVSSDGGGGGFMDMGDGEEGSAGARAMAAAEGGYGDPKRVKRSASFFSTVHNYRGETVKAHNFFTFNIHLFTVSLEPTIIYS